MDLVPLKLWKHLLAKHCRFGDRSRFEYACDPLGYRPLREAYCAYLRRARAVNCSADNVVVFFARELRVNILCRLLLKSDDCVAVENPGNPLVRQSFEVEGAFILEDDYDSEHSQNIFCYAICAERSALAQS